MESEHIMAMWSRATCQVPVANYDDLLEMLATEIAKISMKLSEEELYRMIAVGALMYQQRYKESGGDITVDLLIKTLREGGRA